MRRVWAASTALAALVVVACVAPGALAGTAPAAPGSPAMSCWRNPERGVATRCTANFDLARSAHASFSFVVSPRDADNRVYDLEVEVASDEGDANL